jgi:putative transposase
MKTYPSDLTKRERKFIKPHLFKRGNPRRQKWKWKTILNALMFLAPHQHLTGLGRYILRTGCQWRALPDSFPPWQTIYEYHRRFCELGIWEKLNTELRICLRLLEKRNAQPSAVVFDTQSVKALHGGEERGFDGYKRVNGRKRFLLVERPKPVRCWCGAKNTLGLLLLVKVIPGNTAETKAAMIGLERVNEVFDMVQLAWADQRPCPSGASYGQDRALVVSH